MSELQDIPRLVREFIELAKAYLVQETVEPAKKLGYFAGMSIGAALLWAVALILLSVAGLRALVGVLPEGPYWQSLSYVIYSVALVAFCALVIAVVPDRGVHDTPQHKEEI